MFQNQNFFGQVKANVSAWWKKRNGWWRKWKFIVGQTRWRHQECWQEKMNSDLNRSGPSADIQPPKLTGLFMIKSLNTQVTTLKATHEFLSAFYCGVFSFCKLSSFSPITPLGQWWPKGWRIGLVTWRSWVQSIRIEEDLHLSYYLHRTSRKRPKEDPGGLHQSSWG